MRAYVVSTGTRIAPFGDLARELPIGGTPLFALQAGLLRRFGLEPVQVGSIDAVPNDEPRIVTYDNVLFTRRVLKSFLALWRARSFAPSRVALPNDSAFVRRHADLQRFDVEGPHALFDLYGLPAGDCPSMSGHAKPLAVVFKEKLLRLPAPRAITGMDGWDHPVTSSVCMHLRHWLHVLMANVLSIQIRWVDEVITHPLWAASVLARGLLIGRGRLPWRVAGRANRIGKNVDIHPTAIVEGSFIGDGVTIGPGALVRGSIIGAGATLEQRVDVTFSVIGERAFVSKHSIVYACASFEEAELCMKGMQLCLVGRRAALTARASPMDAAPGRKLRVEDAGTFPTIELPVLGSCYGHDTFIGADVFIGPGRAIPNGVRIAPQPERVLTAIPRDLVPGELYVVRGGTLERSRE